VWDEAAAAGLIVEDERMLELEVGVAGVLPVWSMSCSSHIRHRRGGIRGGWGRERGPRKGDCYEESGRQGRGRVEPRRWRRSEGERRRRRWRRGTDRWCEISGAQGHVEAEPCTTNSMDAYTLLLRSSRDIYGCLLVSVRLRFGLRIERDPFLSFGEPTIKFW
jgi:hypothetical protein